MRNKKNIAGLITIVVIVVAVVFAGCIETTAKTTKVGDIIEQPDEYVGTRVTVEGECISCCPFETWGLSRSFEIRDGTDTIKIYYGGDLPDPLRPKSKRNVRVRGEVGEVETGTGYYYSKEIYIAGESWKYT